MTDSETSPPRPLEIHGTLQLESAAVEARLRKIEEKLEERNGKGALTWILDVLKTLLPSIVLAILGFALKDTVDQALRERWSPIYRKLILSGLTRRPKPLNSPPLAATRFRSS